MQFTEADLKLASRHLPFDMFHFKMYVQMYEGRTATDSASSQAIIYSLLLHLRLLLHFFYGTPTKDDCCVGHFLILSGFEEGFGEPLPIVKPTWEQDVRINLNKRLAHFTATRWRERQPTMNHYAACFPEVIRLIDAFGNGLEKVNGEVGSTFKQRMKELERQYPGKVGATSRLSLQAGS